MPEQRIPITQRQHAMIRSMLEQINSATAQLKAAYNTVLAGHEPLIATCDVQGVDDSNGFQMVIVVPDPPKEGG